MKSFLIAAFALSTMLSAQSALANDTHYIVGYECFIESDKGLIHKEGNINFYPYLIKAEVPLSKKSDSPGPYGLITITRNAKAKQGGVRLKLSTSEASSESIEMNIEDAFKDNKYRIVSNGLVIQCEFKEL